MITSQGWAFSSIVPATASIRPKVAEYIIDKTWNVYKLSPSAFDLPPYLVQQICIWINSIQKIFLQLCLEYLRSQHHNTSLLNKVVWHAKISFKVPFSYEKCSDKRISVDAKSPAYIHYKRKKFYVVGLLYCRGDKSRIILLDWCRLYISELECP